MAGILVSDILRAPRGPQHSRYYYAWIMLVVDDVSTMTTIRNTTRQKKEKGTKTA